MRTGTSAAGPACWRAAITKLALLLLAVAAVAPAAEPAAVLDRSVAAGGRTDVTSLYLRFTIVAQGDADPVRLEVWQAAPDRRLETISQGGKVLVKTGCVGEEAWQWTPDGGVRTLDPDDARRVRYLSLFQPLTRWRDIFTTVEAAGEVDVEGVACQCLRLGVEWAAPRRYCFAATDGLLRAMFEPVGNGELARLYSDYKVFDGLQLPTHVRVRAGSNELRLQLVEAKVNPPLDAALFQRPPA